MSRAQRRLHLMIWICATAAMATLVIGGLQAKQGADNRRAAAAQAMEQR